MNFDVKIRKSRDGMTPFLPNIQVRGDDIQIVEKFKYLGVMIDQKLKFDAQLGNTVRSVNSKLYLLAKVRRCINSSTALTIYKSMVLPYLEFANCFLMGCTQTEKVKLQRLQNRGLKIALARDRLYDTNQLHVEGNIEKWETRAKASLCKLIFKYKHNEDYVVSGRGTRMHDGPIFEIDFPKTDWFARSTSTICRKEWNTLPSHIRLINTAHEFKNAIKRHYRSTHSQ